MGQHWVILIVGQELRYFSELHAAFWLEKEIGDLKMIHRLILSINPFKFYTKGLIFCCFIEYETAGWREKITFFFF